MNELNIPYITTKQYICLKQMKQFEYEHNIKYKQIVLNEYNDMLKIDIIYLCYNKIDSCNIFNVIKSCILFVVSAIMIENDYIVFHPHSCMHYYLCFNCNFFCLVTHLLASLS